MTQLPDLGRLPLHPTGVSGDADLDFGQFPYGGDSRIRKEYKNALKDPDPGLASTHLTWTHEDGTNSKFHPFTWTFHMRGGAYKIYVRFPTEYPFKAPHYYISTFHGKRVGVKKYLLWVARRKAQSRGYFELSRPGDTDRLDRTYVWAVEHMLATDENLRLGGPGEREWIPTARAIDFIKGLNSETPLIRLLMEAHLHRVPNNISRA
mgnify:CR=1 FL=1